MTTEIIAVAIGIGVAFFLILAIEGAFPYVYRWCKEVGVWWVSGQWKPPEQIKYKKFQGGQIVIAFGKPVAVNGMHLVVITDRGLRAMVCAGEAVDTGEFWRTWKHLGGDRDGWFDDETGERIDLE